MQPDIKPSNDSSEFETEERCSILEVANDANDPDVSIARARVKPGVTTAWHQLKGTTERYLILFGQGRVEIDTLQATDVGAGDVVRIPANTPQRITNTGATDLIFYAICSPRFQAKCYQAL
jgi:mannose-6-phosphate isomerase-like protein (cupin superfamily)